jgi:hypothetical protein
LAPFGWAAGWCCHLLSPTPFTDLSKGPGCWFWFGTGFSSSFFHYLPTTTN